MIQVQLDFESAQTMQIEVTATSQDGSTSSETFNIAINDADEFDVSAVTDTDATTNEVSESVQLAGTSVGVTAFAEVMQTVRTVMSLIQFQVQIRAMRLPLMRILVRSR